MRLLRLCVRSFHARLEFYLEKSRPEFSGDEESIACLIVSDAVQHGLFVVNVAGRQQAIQINPARNAAVLRIDRHYSVVVPDVGVDFAVDVLEFVQLFDWQIAVEYCDGLCDLKAVRVEKSDAVRAVADDERMAVGRKAPAFAGVVKLADLLESVGVVDEADLVLPG